MQTRINAVASLYDVIAHSSAFGPVDMPSYLNGIAARIRASLIGTYSTIAVEVDAEPLSINAAVAVGLMVNELATNAIKYAFPDGKGKISLGFRRREDELILSVEDNGVGLEGAVAQEGSSGMGTCFVEAFVRQIGGVLARASGPTGTTVAVRLPASLLE